MVIQWDGGVEAPSGLPVLAQGFDAPQSLFKAFTSGLAAISPHKVAGGEWPPQRASLYPQLPGCVAHSQPGAPEWMPVGCGAHGTAAEAMAPNSKIATNNLKYIENIQ